MKTFIAICVFLFVHYSNGKYISRHLLENVVQDSAVCKSVEFDNGEVEFNHYVSNHVRAEVCARRIHNYNATGRMPSKYLGEEYNIVSHQNPCQVVCRYDPLHESIADEHQVVEEHHVVDEHHVVVENNLVVEHVQEYYEEEKVIPFSYAQYRNLPEIEFKLAENTKCGQKHVCNALGCCVREQVQHPEEPVVPHEPQEPHEPHTPEEHKTPEETHEPHEPHIPEEHKTPEEPKEPHEPHVPEEHKTPDETKIPEEPKEPEVPHEPNEPHGPHTPEETKTPEEIKTPEEPKIPEIVEKEISCSESGVFADPEDETSFFRCYLKSAHIKCAEGMVFNSETHECHTPVPPEQDFDKLVSCSREGFFRNPYDCKRFYRCYHNDQIERSEGNLRIGFYKCHDNMVFDQTHQTCVLASNTNECKNVMVPNEPQDVKEDKEPEYQKILKCTDEGYFRNPFECHRFYRCYYNHHSETTLNLSLYVCGHGKVFDEVSKNCVPQYRTAECLNKQLPVEEHIAHYRQ